MKELAAAALEYNVKILEATASSVESDDIFVREALWKRKLGTRGVGLYRN